jgi:hypothetical protein
VNQCCDGKKGMTVVTALLSSFILKDHLQRDDVLGRNRKRSESSTSIDNRDRMSVHHSWKGTEEDNQTDPGKLKK